MAAMGHERERRERGGSSGLTCPRLNTATCIQKDCTAPTTTVNDDGNKASPENSLLQEYPGVSRLKVDNEEIATAPRKQIWLEEKKLGLASIL